MLDGLEPGDAFGVRTSWGVVASGIIEHITDKTADEVRPGDWILILANPEMWDISGETRRDVTIDKGRPARYDGDDWTGPGLSLAVGTDKNGFDFTGEVILRQPEPVRRNGKITHYEPLPAGLVESVAIGPVVDLDSLLDQDETPEKEVV